ncbi:NADH:ubiquinone oxidoreductase 24 kD subunit [Halobacteroides halobius DSM 5150]|uniref:NADH:ubiquinone oxidoreductase 24 kD subunit n=1 Tax=Halobacteroides halobius (strain ATCC 35273 / DSM 5150 / MD-1) TaxID=748449 RepID=L0K763_HALHC|nr:NAD(P)H-dependent oxidoreductase subunit E [Halobacteroides halobius]AGB40370.1 NADH:ubiquinone oxidoreductase 24 kD subunit [Halobacteroides halobius DSM 5150]
MKQEEKEKKAKLKEVIQEAKESDEINIVKIVNQAQDIYGHVSRDIQVKLAEGVGIPLSEIYSVVSFYSLFSTTPRAENTIEVCMGTACYVKGSQDILDEFSDELKIEPGEVTEDGKFGLESTRCIGACGRAPVIVAGEDIHGGLDVDGVSKILDQYQ